ncbi:MULTISPECIES: TetR family transcriptional regulator [unclassified Streptomyces]|uniref:TetR/AcrR family transcriptional regulator n=1 Tax=unclassified Streptomyces TaxID=2593676 RepID=UPI002DDB37C0|nr:MULTISPECIES: TetR family transcriptional regulator [unclassified Streptomyces]WSA94864.1 TetR family transcriptional regulator [Streptomyces sp. NBC_01795]WSB79284.1 TetR family transcriptional regulator [Streptomyces sp. NBC_01775]WSS12512.1 TetR family transcriptional regulator [Streptomyces sp. NBC_01186]WSS41298.1 TetR family transcriptional regulator [Streptomyces sp. NBC_01187]
MPPEALTPERVLEATEEVLRRYGPAKATVVDVARALGVSHGSVYRHFRTKAALRDAVTKRWLDRTSAKLEGVVASAAPPEERLENWLASLFTAKKHKAGDDPELFATYVTLAGEASTVVNAYVEGLIAQLAHIIDDGIEAGAFAPPSVDTTTTARAVLDTTARFHDPRYMAEWSSPGIDEAFRGVLALVLRGLRA